MIRFAEKKGMGAIGVFLILCVATFVFTIVYIVLSNLFQNLLPSLTTDASTLAFFQSCLLPVFKSLPYFFLFSMIIWGVLQPQTPFSMFSIGGFWVVIMFSWFSFSSIFMLFDPYVMVDIPTLIPAEATYWISFYNDFVKVLWRGVPWPLAIALVFFGLWMASTRYEQTGPTYGGYYQ